MVGRRRRRTFTQLAPQGGDVDVERLGRAVPVLVPHFVHDALARHRAPDFRRQQHEQIELARSQRELARPGPRPAGRDVDLDVTGRQHLDGRLAPRGAAGAPGPREQFREPERFGDVVVGAGVQPDDDVRFLLARGEHDDRRGRCARSELPAEVDTVGVGEPEVEEHQIRNQALERRPRSRRRPRASPCSPHRPMPAPRTGR